MRKRGASDGYLLQLWRRAVMKRWGDRCIVCGAVTDLDCNHIIKRRVRLLRYDPDNGVPVCRMRQSPYAIGKSCHQWAESLDGLEYIRGLVGRSVWHKLRGRENLSKKSYLTKQGQTDDDWRNEVKAGLLEELNENK
jgi:hypothetical protein